VLEQYESCYGEQGGQHNEHTRACAHLLHEAYEKTGNVSKAQEVKERYSLRSVHYVPFLDVVVESRSLGKRFYTIVLLFVIWVLVYLWGATLSGEL